MSRLVYTTTTRRIDRRHLAAVQAMSKGAVTTVRRCEADFSDGGVCGARLTVGGNCPQEGEHA